MKKIVCILNVLFVYLVMFLPLFIFFGNKISVLEYIWEHFFDNNAFIPIGLLLGLGFISLIMNIIFCFKTINDDNIDVNNLIKSNMIVKLILIPAYIIIFLIGSICLITIFTMGITIGLMILSFLGLIMTGIYSVTCYKKLKDQKLITNNELTLYSIFSFVYCIDVDI